jgi:hypothetical protein
MGSQQRFSSIKYKMLNFTHEQKIFKSFIFDEIYSQDININHTVAATLSQSDINAWNPAPNTDPAVL